jgi:hypothetical protein
MHLNQTIIHRNIISANIAFIYLLFTMYSKRYEQEKKANRTIEDFTIVSNEQYRTSEQQQLDRMRTYIIVVDSLNVNLMLSDDDRND